MPPPDEKTRLLQVLERAAAAQAGSANAQLLRELEKCSSSKSACALLVNALRISRPAKDRGELLTADPGWIHPFA